MGARQLENRATWRANWWTWIQLVVLCVSIPTNVFLWFRSDDLRSRLAFANFNDLAWHSLDEFRLTNDVVGDSASQQVFELLRISPWWYFSDLMPEASKSPKTSKSLTLRIEQDTVWDSWLERLEALEGRWVKRIEPALSKSRSQMIAYELAAGKDLPAARRLAILSDSLRSPCLQAIQYLQSCQALLRRMSEVKRWISPVFDPSEDLIAGEPEASLHGRLEVYRDASHLLHLVDRMDTLDSLLVEVSKRTRISLGIGS